MLLLQKKKAYVSFIKNDEKGEELETKNPSKITNYEKMKRLLGKGNFG